jgi:hypothetical protein
LLETLNERAEFETAAKGWLDGVQVQLPDGSRRAVFFYDPVGLQQDLAEYERLGRPYLVEPGLIVLPEVTPAAIRKAVEELCRQEYFCDLKPLPPAN